MSTVIEVYNDFSWLNTDDEELKGFLWKILRFRDPAAFFTQRNAKNTWAGAGYYEFFKRDTGRFLTGLLVEIKAALAAKEIPYTISDHRNSLVFPHQSIDDQFLNQWLAPGEPPVKLFDYQIDAINAAIKYHRGLVVAPTSAGKTNILIGILKSLPANTPTIVLTDGADLTEQNYLEIKKWGFNNVGRIYGKYQDPNVITCTTTKSVSKLKKIYPYIRAILVDEVHACMSKLPLACYAGLKNASIRIGISATPITDEEDKAKSNIPKHKVKGHFGPIFKLNSIEGGKLTTAILQERKIVSASNCTFFNVYEPPLPYEIYTDAVRYGIAENHYLHQMIKKLALSLTGRTLIIVERLSQGEILNKMIPGSYWIAGEDSADAKREVKQLLKTSENVTAIVSQKIISKGINVFIHNFINAAGGKASHNTIQRMGRGLRLAGDKNILQYYDFMFFINEYLQAHSSHRIKTLKKEGHTVTVKDFDL